MKELLLKNNLICDEELIRSFILEKDETSFISLLTRHIKGIRKLLYTIFNGNREDMEDAEQEIILNLYNKYNGGEKNE